MYGEKIKTIRLLRGFTQEYVADKLDIKQNTYSKIESGQTRLDVDILKKLAEILGVSQADIINNQPTIINFEANNSNRDTDHFYHKRDFVEKIIASKDSEIQYLKEIISSLIKDKELMLELIKINP